MHQVQEPSKDLTGTAPLATSAARSHNLIACPQRFLYIDAILGLLQHLYGALHAVLIHCVSLCAELLYIEIAPPIRPMLQVNTSLI
jgi:hypothetical protein